MIRRPPRSTQSRSSAASDVYKRQVERHPHLDATLGEGAVLVVLEEQAGGGIASHVDFRPSIVVEVRRDSRQSIGSGRFRDPRRNADIGEGAVAVVAVQHLSLRLEAARTAVHGDALEIADIVLAGGRDDLGIEPVSYTHL